MFVDRARIRVVAGRGGNGCCSFRRESFVPFGGPDGGDGGNGGNILFKADERLSSLLDLRYHGLWKGHPGGHGQGSDCHGKNGKDILISVPPGTVVLRVDAESGETEAVADLTEPGQTFVAARGGRGGKGNARFVTSTNRAPRFAEVGEPGEDFAFQLELKLIAEVGLVGFPNAGKSTLLTALTAARPKIADYPFTTLSPNLGVAYLSDYRTFTLADIPGIIEGAAEGKGLGHDFLRHIERTKVLVFVIDLGDEDPVRTRRLLEEELAQYSPVFAKRPKVFVLNKADIPENQERYKKIYRRFKQPVRISAATGEGVRPLAEKLWGILDRIRTEDPLAGEVEEEAEREIRYEAPFTVAPEGDGFRVEGAAVVRAVRMTDFDNEEALQHLQKRLQKMGLFRVLKRMGARPGQSIYIDETELEYFPD